MAYFSDVAISTTTEGYNLLKDFCDNNQIHQKVYQLVGNNIHPQIEEIDIKSNSVIFGWNRIKWNESFPECYQLREALEYLKGEKIPWEFLRIGEDDNDVERKSSSFDLLPKGLKQEIVWVSNNDHVSDSDKSINAIDAIDEAVSFLRENEQYGDDWNDVIFALNDLRGQLLQR